MKLLLQNGYHAGVVNYNINDVLNRQQNKPKNPTTTVPKKETILVLPINITSLWPACDFVTRKVNNSYCYTSQLKYVSWLEENVSRTIGQNSMTPQGEQNLMTP